MEIERPKQKIKRKKKTAAAAAADDAAYNVTTDSVIAAMSEIDIDIDFPSTSNLDNIPNTECNIASGITELDILDNDDDNDIETELTNQEINVVNFELVKDDEQIVVDMENSIQIVEDMSNNKENQNITAPLEESFDQFTGTGNLATTSTAFLVEKPLNTIQYPNLQTIQQEIDEIPTINLLIKPKELNNLIETIKPFTDEQLNEMYQNPQAEHAEKFELEFLNTELNTNYRNHILYELLTKYARARHNLKMNDVDIKDLRKIFTINSEKLWIQESRSINYSGTCADGVVCSATETYPYISIDEQLFDKTSSNLNDLMNIICFNYTNNLYAAEVVRIQIEQIIREVLYGVVENHRLQPQSPVTLNADTNQQKLLQQIQHIRLAISILFFFLRQSTPDKIFSNDLKEWLQQLVSHLLRIATWQDHLFLIYHVLRCPAGVSNWASAFIQLPKPDQRNHLSPFSSNELHHCITFLRAILFPINQRSEFLIHRNSGGVRGQSTTTTTTTTNNDCELSIDIVNEDFCWTLVDSDGEDDYSTDGECEMLKEKDLIAFLNQIPLEALFGSITFVQKKNNSYILYEDFITGNYLLKFIAFSTNFIQLLSEGLSTYHHDRYKQFAKRLSRLVRHSVLYLDEMHTIFKKNDTTKDSHLCARIQVEFDAFVMRASNCIYKSRFLGTWQYLAILPFRELCSKTIWKLYYYLIMGDIPAECNSTEIDFKEKVISEIEIIEKFNDTIIDLPADDTYYLLQTFSSMALERDVTIDQDFIEHVTLDLFKIGYVNELTKETCYKIVRDLLVNITTKYPSLISTILVTLKNSFKIVDTGAIYLFKSLPLNQWYPSAEDFDMGASWLLNFGYETPESSLARTMFSRLNWNFAANNIDLFLDHDMHIRMACLIAEVACRHVPETIGVSGISESVRQVSNMVKGQQSTKEQFTKWCWNMVTILRLHCLDQSRDIRQRVMRSPSVAMQLIPEVERLQAIFQGVSDSRPIALYLSILCTLWGHSVPQICHIGFQKLQTLLSDYRHSIVIRCLQLIVPLFLECPESLSKCDKFQTILTQILQSDRTYLKMAKDLITSDYPGPVVELLGNMIQAQIIDHYNYGLTTPNQLVILWLQCFTQLPNWTKDLNAIYIVDLILRVAFQFKDTWFNTKEYFRFLYTKFDDYKQSRSSSFIPFFGSGTQQNTPLPPPAPGALWLALITLEIEHEQLEIQSKLWPELLRQLRSSSLKFSMDNVIKQAANSVGCNSVASTNLVIFKLVNLIITSPNEHPLMPILLQRFFLLYLERVPLTLDEQRLSDIFGVSDKFYESNITLMKKLKKWIISSETYYNDESLKTDDESLCAYFGSCCRLFRTYGVWLEETQLNKMFSLSDDSKYPPLFDIQRLITIFSQQENYWTEFIHLPSIRKLQKDAANSWSKTCFRYDGHTNKSTFQTQLSSVKDETNKDPKENIIQHIQSYDLPLDPPELKYEQPLLDLNVQPKEMIRKMLPQMKTDFCQLDKSANEFDQTLLGLKFMDCQYKDLIRILYSNENRKCQRSVKCSYFLSNNSCKGSRIVDILISEPIRNERIQTKIEKNRLRHDETIDAQISKPPDSTIMALVKIQHYIRQIIKTHNLVKQQINEPTIMMANEISDCGIQFFYYILNNINENINQFPPTHDLMTDIISNLGILIKENQNTEGIRLLKLAMSNPHLVKLISEIFIPSITAPVHFLEMYRFVVDSHMKKCDAQTLFVLFSKFDVGKWLTIFKPKLVDINQLLRLIIQGLESWNQKDAELIQGILRRHLIHIFEYDFPEHYGEVLQAVIIGCSGSEQKLLPAVLYDIICSIYKLGNCLIPPENEKSNSHRINTEIINFATIQKIFPFKVLQDTIQLIARHYQTERLQYGLHGLYPKHKDYCDTISILLKTLNYSLVVSAVHAYPGVLADKLVEWIWPSFCDVYSPWMVPYYPQSMQNSQPANWIRQVLSNNDVLLPWSELYGIQSQIMLGSFLDCIQYLLDTLPASDAILGNIFYWYEMYFGKISVPHYILKGVHKNLVLLPWNRFRPQPIHIDGFYRSLQQFLPECHSFLGYVFLNISWQPWLHYNLQHWPIDQRQKMVSSLLLIFVKLSFEPTVRENQQFEQVLREATTYPWYLLEFSSINSVFDWFVLTTEPSIILTLNSEHQTIDSGVLTILQMAASMHQNNPSNLSAPQLHAKRLLYVKSVVRLLRLCGTKYQNLLSNKDGVKSFHKAVNQMMNMIENITLEMTNTGGFTVNEIDVIEFMNEIIGTLQGQGEFTSKIFVEALVIWQSNSKIGSRALCASLNAIGGCKAFTSNLVMLLEATIFNYFRYLETTKEQHNPTWYNLMTRLGPSLPSVEASELVQRSHLLSLHIYTVYKLKTLRTIGDKITFLQNLHRILETFKTNESTEPKIAILWGLIIICGIEFMKNGGEKSANSLLLTLARFLQTASNQSDGWSDGVLGAIGLKRDTISKKRRLLTRSLSCFIFTLFPDELSSGKFCKEFMVAIDDLSQNVNAKKFADLRNEGTMAIELIQQPKYDVNNGTDRTKNIVCGLIRLFYKESFLNTLEEIWNF